MLCALRYRRKDGIMDAALEYLARRQLLERIYDRMTDEERRLFVQMALQNRSTDEIWQALQQQSEQIAQVAAKVNRQSWITDFGSDVAANFLTDGLILLARRLFR